MRHDSAQAEDVVIVGAGAAGLMAACLIGRLNPDQRIIVLEGNSRPAAKLLLTGGGRCNVTNRHVGPDDFTGSSRNVIRKTLAAFAVEDTVAFFAEIGVRLREEDGGKLFPKDGRAHTVRNALIGTASNSGADILTGHKVEVIVRSDDGYLIRYPCGTMRARQVLLTTGGRSYPRTGSDGSGYGIAEALGHSIAPTTPALVPLVLAGRFHAGLSGISHDVEITLSAGGKKLSTRGPLLWTHFGISGPAVLDISGHWLRASLDGLHPELNANLLPGEDIVRLDRKWIELAATHPRTALRNALALSLPAKLADAVLGQLEISGSTSLAHLEKVARRRLLNALLSWPLPVMESRGYDHAEVTAGGVPLSEVNPTTMESRLCPGLFLAGEILDVTGRVGGFNLQWAWSSAAVAARAIVGDNAARARRTRT